MTQVESAVYAARRDAFMATIGATGVAIVRSLPERLRNGDSYHAFRQHSDVVYLTGFVEPETTLILRPGAETERIVMFVRPRDPEREIWDGRRAGVEGAVSQYGADAAYPSTELATRLADLLANHTELHYSLGVDEDLDKIVGRTLARLRLMEKRGKRPPRAIVDLQATLHEQRLFKRPEELAAMRQAAAITSDAHIAAMKRGRPGTNEQELAAVIEFTFKSKGGNAPGYESIVGAGANATILHYIENNARITDGDLVLVDAGSEYGHYTADITRTWPANGTFSAPQREVYEKVLAVQKSAIDLAKPGATLTEIHDHCVRELTQAMIDLGLLTGTVDERIADSAYKKFYMHLTSHWLGLDVHDVGAYTHDGGKPRPLAPGMVITIEPGLYIAADAPDVPAQYRGIGVRIEDDVAITATGNDVLTAACPKEIAELEALCRS
jgi:Xaa-Pro aminopeptidase